MEVRSVVNALPCERLCVEPRWRHEVSVLVHYDTCIHAAWMEYKSIFGVDRHAPPTTTLTELHSHSRSFDPLSQEVYDGLCMVDRLDFVIVQAEHIDARCIASSNSCEASTVHQKTLRIASS